MASGKSTIGKALSKRIGYDFIDTDKMIEEELKLSIPEIFEKYGEPYFRDKETAVIKSITKDKKVVISVGGGLPCFNNNIQKLKSSGLVVFLKSGFETSYKRIIKNKKRPLGNALTKNKLRLLYKSRLPIYTKADYIVLANREIPKVVERMITLIDN